MPPEDLINVRFSVSEREGKGGGKGSRGLEMILDTNALSAVADADPGAVVLFRQATIVLAEYQCAGSTPVHYYPVIVTSKQ